MNPAFILQHKPGHRCFIAPLTGAFCKRRSMKEVNAQTAPTNPETGHDD